ncbi:hypothetical protein KEM52_003525 [Ascosphaera acerosa]|nr:hypothetical protein KEM52_003525 [Ascosphaera acerosa]
MDHRGTPTNQHPARSPLQDGSNRANVSPGPAAPRRQAGKAAPRVYAIVYRTSHSRHSSGERDRERPMTAYRPSSAEAPRRSRSSFRREERERVLRASSRSRSRSRSLESVDREAAHEGSRLRGSHHPAQAAYADAEVGDEVEMPSQRGRSGMCSPSEMGLNRDMAGQLLDRAS